MNGRPDNALPPNGRPPNGRPPQETTPGAVRGLDLPPRVRESIASAVAARGPQARTVSTQGRESMRPPQGHVVVAASQGEIDGIRGAARIVRQLEFYRTFYGPVVRLAFTVYPQVGAPLSAATLLDVSQVSGEAALSGLGRQKSIFFHFYSATEGEVGRDLGYEFSKEIPNAPSQRSEAKKVHKLARDAFSETPEARRSFRSAVGLAEGQFESSVPEPEGER